MYRYNPDKSRISQKTLNSQNEVVKQPRFSGFCLHADTSVRFTQQTTSPKYRDLQLFQYKDGGIFQNHKSLK